MSEPSTGVAHPAGPRVWQICVLSLVLQVLLGGVRFNDGQSLVEFSRDGFFAELRPHFEYLLDSQLKVAVLYALGWEKPILIGLLFLGISLLPFAVVLLLDRPIRLPVLLILSLMPLARVLFSYVGIGDGVTISFGIILALSGCIPLILFSGAALILWHLHQGVIICLSLAAMLLIRKYPRDTLKAISILFSSIIGTILHYLNKYLFIPEYSGRNQYVMENIDQLLPVAAIMFPLAIIVCAPGIYIYMSLRLRKPATRYEIFASLGLAAITLVSIIAVDRSRVLFVVSLPLILHMIEPWLRDSAITQKFGRWSLALPLVALSAVLPLSAAQHVDVYLWPQLIEDLRNWW